MTRRSRQRGVSLIEILVAVLVFAFGMAGTGALLIAAARSNQSAYLRSQAIFLAQGMSDRMRINPIGVWTQAYDGDYPHVGRSMPCRAAACDPAALAAHDKAAWSAQLRQHLPNPTGRLRCDRSQAGYDPVSTGQIGLRPPFGGSCHLTIQWDGRVIIAGADARQTLTWEFQP
ncbi:type IV pilus modification protein PilV [Dyella sp.]|uniref:type IV pilus modification protein PilV n=1 Tax=Dyella sp. TaxID=1869338 RepID=UPI002ED245FB